MRSDTWKCHVCKEERPDRFISVRQHHTVLKGVDITQNVRYCNDREACIAGAEDFRFLRENEE